MEYIANILKHNELMRFLKDLILLNFVIFLCLIVEFCGILWNFVYFCGNVSQVRNNSKCKNEEKLTNLD